MKSYTKRYGVQSPQFLPKTSKIKEIIDEYLNTNSMCLSSFSIKKVENSDEYLYYKLHIKIKDKENYTNTTFYYIIDNLYGEVQNHIMTKKNPSELDIEIIDYIKSKYPFLIIVNNLNL